MNLEWLREVMLPPPQFLCYWQHSYLLRPSSLFSVELLLKTENKNKILIFSWHLLWQIMQKKKILICSYLFSKTLWNEIIILHMGKMKLWNVKCSCILINSGTEIQTQCNRLNWVPWQKFLFQPYHPLSRNVILFGNRVFIDVIS